MRPTNPTTTTSSFLNPTLRGQVRFSSGLFPADTLAGQTTQTKELKKNFSVDDDGLPLSSPPACQREDVTSADVASMWVVRFRPSSRRRRGADAVEAVAVAVAVAVAQLHVLAEDLKQLVPFLVQLGDLRTQRVVVHFQALGLLPHTHTQANTINVGHYHRRRRGSHRHHQCHHSSVTIRTITIIAIIVYNDNDATDRQTNKQTTTTTKTQPTHPTNRPINQSATT